MGPIVSTTAGNRPIRIHDKTATNTYSGGYYGWNVGLGAVNKWRRVEVDLQAVLDALTPGVTYLSTLDIYAFGQGIRIDDLRFSNSVTVEHNVFGGGVVGHLLRNRTTNAATGAATDRWFHYDQVGSVISESNASGALAQTHHQDAFGNTQSAWTTGLWGGDPGSSSPIG